MINKKYMFVVIIGIVITVIFSIFPQYEILTNSFNTIMQGVGLIIVLIGIFLVNREKVE
ncbi:hypothetical protein [Geotoga petraea]|jgi:uncharacterized membrane protein|uniref:Uncharacterized protein n=1 Tax=Geotoga petraea TaxID=28234 RepID=A0A1G6M427_9BACT|nr:hypothetical protein [Geotoga petraea]SDC50191.1 hypothetical protein SAMN04488588_1229 [Geotoga petraea]